MLLCRCCCYCHCRTSIITQLDTVVGVKVSHNNAKSKPLSTYKGELVVVVVLKYFVVVLYLYLVVIVFELIIVFVFHVDNNQIIL